MCIYATRDAVGGRDREALLATGSPPGILLRAGQDITIQNHKSQVPLENATESPLDDSSENPLDK